MFIKPAEGLKVRHPDTRRFLADEGEEVTVNDYWLRRVRDGDVVESDAPESAEDKPETAAESEVPIATETPAAPANDPAHDAT